MAGLRLIWFLPLAKSYLSFVPARTQGRILFFIDSYYVRNENCDSPTGSEHLGLSNSFYAQLWGTETPIF